MFGVWKLTKVETEMIILTEIGLYSISKCWNLGWQLVSNISILPPGYNFSPSSADNKTYAKRDGLDPWWSTIQKPSLETLSTASATIRRCPLI